MADEKQEPSEQRAALQLQNPAQLGAWFAEGIRHGVAASRRDWLIFVASRPVEEHAKLLHLTHKAPWLPQPPTYIFPSSSRVQ